MLKFNCMCMWRTMFVAVLLITMGMMSTSAMAQVCGDANAGDCCSANGTPGCNDAECCELVCSIDAFCCNNSWDSICAGEAADLCQLCGGGGPDNGTCADCQPIGGNGGYYGSTIGVAPDGVVTSCAGNDTIAVWYCYHATCDGTVIITTCSPTTNYDTALAVFDSCGGAEIACNDDDPSCIETQSTLEFSSVDGTVYFIRVSGWNGAIGDFLMTYSCDPGPGICETAAGNCCVAGGNGTPGCNNVTCCETICAIDPFCCDNSWDGICATAAVDLCGVCGAGACGPGNGDCCDVNSTPGCDNAVCCLAICAIDPFCCDNSWDIICAGEAQALCGVCGAGACGSGNGDCCIANGTPGCEDTECCQTVCAIDPFCCDSFWDSLCASEAADLCEDCAGDTCNNCIPVDEGIIIGTTADNGSEADITSCTFMDTITEWYCYTASCDGTAIVDTFIGNNFIYNTSLAAFSSCGGNEIACNDDICGGLRSQISFAVVAGGIYYIRLSGFDGDSGPFFLNITCLPNPECGVPSAGNCYDANNDTPFCNDAECCDAVCAIDPSCCATVWDDQCVDEAIELCGPPPNGAICNDAGDTQLTQSVDLTTLAGFGIACGNADGTTAYQSARSYTMKGDLGITCVGFGIEANQGNHPALPATINIYLDTDGGAPQAPGIDLKLLGSSDVVIGLATPFSILWGTYDPPICVSAGQVIVVELDISSGQTTTPLTHVFPGANCYGQTGPSYYKADACNVATYVDLAGFGFPNSHLVNVINGYADFNCDAKPCPADLDGDGSVGTADLLELFAQWGQVGVPADFDGGGVGTSDLLILFANWGPCP